MAAAKPPDRLVEIGPGIAVVLCLLVLLAGMTIFLMHRTLLRRLQTLESRMDRHIAHRQGPTVRQFCRSLIETLKLYIPPNEVPCPEHREDSDFIRGLVFHLKKRRRQRLAQEARISQMRSVLAKVITIVKSNPRPGKTQKSSIESVSNLAHPKIEKLTQAVETRVREFEDRMKQCQALHTNLSETLAGAQQYEVLLGRCEHSRESLSTLHESLDQQVSKRQDLLNRIDSQLRQRQIQLVTDILRAEGGHLELSHLLDKVEETLLSLRDLTDWTERGREQSEPAIDQSTSSKADRP